MSIKVGIIGAGRMGNLHLKHLQSIKEVEITSICDVNIENAESLAKLVGAKVYEDYRKMYKKGNMDAVFICTPAFIRSEQEILAAQRGIHLFIEKPPARTMKKGKEIIRVIEKTGVICSVGFPWRYLDTVDKLQEVLKRKKVALIYAQWLHTIPPVAWVRSKEKGGGQIVDQSIHMVDLMRYVVGEVDRVYAQGTKGLFKEIDDFTADDASALTLTFKNGTVANLSSTYSLFAAEGHGPKMNFVSKRVRIEFDCNNMRIISTRAKAGFDRNAHTMHLKPKSSSSLKIQKVKTNIDPYYIEDKMFIDAIKSGDRSKIKSPYQDALRTLQVALAANDSIEKNKVIRL